MLLRQVQRKSKIDFSDASARQHLLPETVPVINDYWSEMSGQKVVYREEKKCTNTSFSSTDNKNNDNLFPVGFRHENCTYWTLNIILLKCIYV